MKRVLNLILTHQSADQINRTLGWWRARAPGAEILLLVTSRDTDLAKIDHSHMVVVDDKRLHTRDHSREFQSYTPAFAAASDWLKNQSFDYLHFAEYDHLPMLADFNARQESLLLAENADVLCFELARVDDTNQAHYVYHKHNPSFHAFWESMSCRSDRRTVLSMLGSGSFWSRAAFDAVAAQAEPFRVYLELWLPTLAHHLGFRVRPFVGEQASGCVSAFVSKDLLEVAQRRGAWTAHPVKVLPASF